MVSDTAILKMLMIEYYDIIAVFKCLSGAIFKYFYDKNVKSTKGFKFINNLKKNKISD